MQNLKYSIKEELDQYKKIKRDIISWCLTPLATKVSMFDALHLQAHSVLQLLDTNLLLKQTVTNVDSISVTFTALNIYNQKVIVTQLQTQVLWWFLSRMPPPPFPSSRCTEEHSR